MAESSFSRLYDARLDTQSTDLAYQVFLNDLFSHGYWSGGPMSNYRVLWKDGPHARLENPSAFKASGLYVWGCETRPLYVGKTNVSFGKRFSRYVWATRSQCNLAQQHEASLRRNGMDGFPPDIHQWYATYTSSTVRLQGAVRFAQEGLSEVWFTLLPHSIATEISDLEKVLVPAAQRWNLQMKFRPLLNIDFVRPRRDKRRI